MINRCYNIKADRYNCYGKVGVTVCDEWKNSFENFYKWAINQEFQIGIELDKDMKSDEVNYPTAKDDWASCFIVP